jgi:membrane protein
MSASPHRPLAPAGVPERQEPARRRIGWWRRLARVSTALSRDNITIMAAGTAYYAMLSIFPGMSAAVLAYGLVGNRASIERDIQGLSGVLPSEALDLVSHQLHTLVTAAPEKLGLGLVVSVLFALWSATSGTVAMMQALTVAYEGREDRSFLHFYGMAIALTVGIAAFVGAALLLIAGVPAAVKSLPLPEIWRQLLPPIRWPILAVLAVLGLGALYRFAPSRNPSHWDFLGAGTIAASLLWLGGSAAFSFYAANFGSYDRTYGSIGAVVVLLVWLYVTAYIILAGAELNGEIERGDGEPPATRDRPSEAAPGPQPE